MKIPQARRESAANKAALAAKRLLDSQNSDSGVLQSTYVRTYVRTYGRTYVRTYVCTYVRTYVRRYVRTYARPHIHTVVMVIVTL